MRGLNFFVERSRPTSQADVPSVQTVPELPPQATPAYTEQQIEEYCRRLDNAGFYAYGPGNWYFDAVQIIRQLQAEYSRLYESHQVMAGCLLDREIESELTPSKGG